MDHPALEALENLSVFLVVSQVDRTDKNADLHHTYKPPTFTTFCWPSPLTCDKIQEIVQKKRWLIQY
jgi:hypothetical protein